MSDYDIGIAELDQQHRRLNELLMQLKNSTQKGYGHAVIVILAEVEVQTRIHFAVEESLMRLLAYPEVVEHIAEHRKLVEQLLEFRKRAQDFNVSDQVSAFIQSWLTDHVMNFDRRFVAHFLSKGVDANASPRNDPEI